MKDKDIQARVRGYGESDGPYRKYDNLKAQGLVLQNFEDADNLKKITDEFEKIAKELSDMSGRYNDPKDKDDKKIRDAIGDLYKVVTNGANNISNSKDWKESTKAFNKVVSTLRDSMGSVKLDKNVVEAINSMADHLSIQTDLAERANEIMKRQSATLAQNLSENLQTIKKNIMDFQNWAGIKQLVSGGKTLEEMRNMQTEVRRTLNLNNSGFMGVQGNLISQNRESYSQYALSFKDSINYLSNIKDYSVKNYDQAVAMYKQISVGTKYLGLTNQNISNLVRTTNALADDDYMNKQLALLSALGTDSALAENTASLAEFLGSNTTNAAARYNNYQDMLTSSLAIKSTSDALLGNQSTLIDSLMAEIMGKSDFSQLSESTKTLLAFTGQASNVWSQMRSGNVDFSNIIQGVLTGSSNLNQYQKTTLESLGLGEWTTLGGTYTRNGDEFQRTLEHQTSILQGIDLTNKDELEKAQSLIAGQNDNKTFFEKFSEGVFNTIGIQNQNWSALLGFVQSFDTVLNGAITLLHIKENLHLAGIERKLSMSKLFGGSGGPSSTGIFSSMTSASGHANALGMAAGGLSIAGGIAWGVSDGLQMSDKEGGFLRGMFLGTGSKENTTAENVGSTLSNGGKWAAIGAGIGTFIAPGLGTAIGGVIGGAAGLLLGIFGSTFDENTEALKKNTTQIKASNDRMVNNSGITSHYITTGDGGPDYAGSYTGIGGGNPTTSYKYRINSGYGMRKHPITGKWAMHNGVDFAFPNHTPIGAAQDGIVSQSKAGYNGGAGQLIDVLGDDGITYRYFHLHQRNVEKGRRVRAGQTIALSGGYPKEDGANAGSSTGPHLHFGTMKNGTYMNPLTYVTSELFNPTGDVAMISQSQVTGNDNTDSKTMLLVSRLGIGGGNPPTSSVNNNYATSQDIDRLIDAITSVKNEQDEQREMMRALSGKNTFVMGRGM